MNEVISSEEIARIINPEWIEEGILLNDAFALRRGETYISVNRPSIDSYDDDISDFVKKHQDFAFSENIYKRALLNVGDVREVKVSLGEINANIDVEVEPRDAHYKSHAGIFTRFENKVIKSGQLLDVHSDEFVSADTILLEVRMSLLGLSTVQEFSVVENNSQEI